MMKSKIQKLLSLLLAIILIGQGIPVIASSGGAVSSIPAAIGNGEHLADVEQSTGMMSTSVDIEVPKYRGLEPVVRLQYSSSGSNSWVGAGWGVIGTSFIVRGSDNGGTPVYNTNDKYYMDGQELIPDTSLGGTHSTKHQSYKKITFDSSANKFYVVEGNGVKYTYEAVHTTAKGIFKWGLKRVEDLNGNAVNYYYWNDGGNEVYLDRIEYNGNVIKFYSETRPDSISYANGTGLSYMNYRLKTIEIKVGSSRARAYKLSYTTSASTQRSVLISSQQYGNDAVLDASGTITGGTSLPAITFQTTNAGVNGDYSLNVQENIGWEYKAEDVFLTGDVDGDGKTDYIRITGVDANSTYGYKHVGIYVAFSQGNGAYTVKLQELSWGWNINYQWMMGDVNADGKSDIMLVAQVGPDAEANYLHYHLHALISIGDGTYQLTGYHISWGCVASYQWMPGDTNGDGKTDFILIAKVGADADANYEHYHIHSLLSNGSGDYTVTGTSISWGYNPNHKWMIGDINGDGKSDIMVVAQAGADAEANNMHHHLHALMSNGDGTYQLTGYHISWGWTSSYQWMPGDTNGDGKTDFILVANVGADAEANYEHYHIHSALSHGDGQYSLTGACRNWGYNPNHKWMIGDVNGDGKSDVMLAAQVGPEAHANYTHYHLHAGISKGDGSYDWTFKDTNWEWDSNSQCIASDTNGDGKTDFMQVTLAQPVAAAASYNGNNIIREIKGAGNTIQIRFRSNSNGFSDEWQTISLGAGTVSGQVVYANSAPNVTSPSGNYSGLNAVTGVRGNGSRLEFKLLVNNVWQWMGMDVPGATFTGSWEDNSSAKGLRNITTNGSQIFVELSTLTVTINCSGMIASGGITGQASPNIFAFQSSGNSMYFVIKNHTSADNWSALSFNPANERRLKQIIGNGHSLSFVTEDLANANQQTHTLTLSGISATNSTTMVTGKYAVALQGAKNGIDIIYNDVPQWERLIFNKDASTKLSTAISVGEIPDIVNKVTNEFGASTEISYSSSSNWPNRQIPEGMIMPTVSSIKTSDGKGNMSNISYSYSCQKFDGVNKAMMGFRYAKAILDAAGNYSEIYFKQTIASSGRPESTYLKNAGGSIYNYSVNSYAEKSTKPYTSNLTEQNVYEQNLQASAIQIRTQYVYDGYGNITQKNEYGNASITGDERTIAIGYYPNTSAYIVNAPAYEEVFTGIGTGGTKLKSTRYIYDANTAYNTAPTKGLLTKRQYWNNQNNQYIQESFQYDSYGNLTKVYNANNNLVNDITYDSIYKMYPIKETNALGQYKQKTWNYTLGKLETETEINNNTASYSYDALGRITQKTLPKGYEKYTYSNWGNPSAQNIRKSVDDGTADGLWEETYFDGLGRTTRILKEGGSTKDTIYSDTSKRVWKESLWYKSGEAVKYIQMAYDGMGRITQEAYPNGVNKRTEYLLGKVAQYDELNNKKETHLDAYGRTNKVTEYNGSNGYNTTYNYDLLHRLTSVVDAKANTTTITWNSLERKISMSDPDKGTTSYTYNNAGSVLSITDAKNQTITYEYDALERMTKKVYPNAAAVTWVYDEAAAANGKGRVTTITYPAGQTKVTAYDYAGNITAETRKVDTTSYNLAYEYDNMNRPKSTTYGDGEKVSYSYNSSGQMSAVSNYVTAMNYNSGGRLTSITYTNGVTESFTYNADREWMNTANVKKGTTTLYDAAYSYDNAARVTNIASTTNSLMNLSFTYDGMNRLTGVSGAQTQSFTYDEIGNMLSNSAIGTYTYGDTAHKHAVTKAGSKTYAYDANGNMTSGDGRTISWDYDNMPSSITKGGVTTSYAYDANGIRIKKSNGTENTYYFGSLMEKDSTGSINYIYAGSRLIAKKQQNGTKSWYHQDHLGSIRLITDSTGAVVKKYDYAAYGKIAQTTGTAANNREFGGQIADPESGLLYMNARYYDSELGRFISADNVVPGGMEEANPQALNRYSYCYNNPITNIDPTGHEPQPLLTIKFAPQLYKLVDEGYNNGTKGPICITPVSVHFDNGTVKSAYLVTISGTEMVKNQATGVITDLRQGFLFENGLSVAVRRAIMNTVPKNSNLIIAGHSLGGMTAQHIAADTTIKKNYNVLNTITFGSPLIGAASREGTVRRLADYNDPIPLLSVNTLSPLIVWQLGGLNIEDGGYSTIDILGAHSSYGRMDEWGKYDAVGKKGGNTYFQYNPQLRQWFKAPLQY